MPVPPPSLVLPAVTLGVWAFLGCYSPSLEPELGRGERSETGGASGGDRTVPPALPPVTASEGPPEIEAPGPQATGASGQAPIAGFTIVTEALPQGCIHDPFYVRLEAMNGGGNYHWQVEARNALGQLVPLPGQIRFDASSGELTGSPAAGSEGLYRLQVLVTGTSAERTARTFDWRVRASCKFAFMGILDERRHLLVADAREAEATRAPRDLTQGAGPEADATSFEIASDGRRVAFEVRRAAPTRALYVADLFEDTAPIAVTLSSTGAPPDEPLEYEWSADAELLAVVSGSAGSTRELSLHDRDGNWLGAVAASEHLSALFWVGDRICYHGTAVGFDAVHCRSLSSRVLPESTETYYRDLAFVFEGAQYLTTADAFVLLVKDTPSSTDRRVSYQPVPGGLSAAHGAGTLSPDRRWVATPDANLPGEMLLYAAADADAVVASIAGCEAVQAWSDDGRYVACRNGAFTRITELDAAGGIVQSADIEGMSLGGGPQRQAFSTPAAGASSRWYVSDTPQRDLAVVDLAQSTWSARHIGVMPPPALDRLGLGFRPGTSELIYHADTALYRVDVERMEVAPLGGLVVPAPAIACLGDYAESGPDFWCGAASALDIFALASDGLAVAFPADDGGIYSVDLLGSGMPQRSGAFFTACTEGVPGCKDQLKFTR